MDFVGALFLPYSGLMRAVEIIMKSSKPGSSDLRKAANAGALCMVVKIAPKALADRYWRKKNRLALDSAGLELEQKYKKQQQGAFDTEETELVSDRGDQDDRNDHLDKYRIFRYLHRLQFHLSTTNPQARRIHGSCKLPRGYLLAPVPSYAIFEEQQAGVKNKEIKIATVYSGLKAAIAVGQAIFASITLYQARGDQIERYGYAAYGLTVIPFLVMSITNLCVNILSADYPRIYCVESIDSDEAVANGGHIVGAVGRLAKSTDLDATIVEEKTLIFSADQVEHTPRYDNHHWQARIQRSGHKIWNSTVATIAKMIVIGGFGSIPIVVIGKLTHWHAGESTRAQRSWLMTWLVLGCWFGPYLASRTPFSSYRGVTLWGKSYYPLIAPGIGGMVVVAQMIRSYGWCTRLEDLTN